MATIEIRLADPASLSGRQCTSSILLKGLFCFVVFLDSVYIKCCSCDCALDLNLVSSLDFYNVSLF